MMKISQSGFTQV